MKSEVREKYEKILCEAEKEFAANGYYSANVDDIALRAGVGKGTVYRYFGDKDSLFLEVVERVLNTLAEKIIKKLEAPTFKECLDNFLDSYTEILSLETDYTKIIYHSVSKSFIDANWNKNFKERKNAELKLIGEMIEFGVRTGEIPKAVEKNKLSKFIWVLLVSIAPRIIFLNESIEEIKCQNRYMQEMILQGIK